MEIARELYGEKDAKAIDSLIGDRGSRAILLQRMGMTLLQNESVLVSPALEQMMLIFSVPSFDKTDEEVVFISRATLQYLPEGNIVPLITEHKGYEFASRTLISCGFFPTSLEKRWKRYGYPKPEFYKEKAKQEFSQIGREDVAENFDRWVQFMNELG